MARYAEQHNNLILWRWLNDSCKARGLSVYLTLHACIELAAAVPAMKKKKIAAAMITKTMGVIAATPSHNTKNHKTWWLPEALQNPHSLFETVEPGAT